MKPTFLSSFKLASVFVLLPIESPVNAGSEQYHWIKLFVRFGMLWFRSFTDRGVQWQKRFCVASAWTSTPLQAG
jgi:hypothetical protein